MNEKEIKNRQVIENEFLKDIKIRQNRFKEIQLPKDVQKQHLIDRFFAIGGNVYIDELKELERDLEKFHIVADDEEIYSLIIVIQMIKRNSRNKERYHLSTDFNRLFTYFKNKEVLTFFQIRIFGIMFAASEDIEELVTVTQKLIQQVENYKQEPDYIRVKFFIYQNAADMIMYIRRKDEDYKYDEYDKILIDYLSNTLPLAKQYGDKYWLGIVTLNLGIVTDDKNIIESAVENLKSLNDERIDKHVQTILHEYNIEY